MNDDAKVFLWHASDKPLGVLTQKYATLHREGGWRWENEKERQVCTYRCVCVCPCVYVCVCLRECRNINWSATSSVIVEDSVCVIWKKIVLESGIKKEMGFIEVRTIFSLIWLTLCILNCSGQQTPSISFISPDIVTDIGLSNFYEIIYI